jgi:hypothetical protein
MRLKDNHKSGFLTLLFAVILLYTAFLSYLTVQINKNKSLSNRVGFGLSTQADPLYWASELNASWYLDWKTTPIASSSTPEYWQMIRLSAQGSKPSTNEIIRLATAYPGHVWIIGNEPDNIWQDNIEAAQFAVFYHDLYYLIKYYDPSAQIAIGAISQATPLRLAYLDQVLAAYTGRFGQKMPVDWWTLHAYVLREEKSSWGADIPSGFKESQGELYEIQDHNNLAIFGQNILNFRRWMKENGYQNKPLAITEFGILLPADFGFQPEVVAEYLADTFEWLVSAKDQEFGYPLDGYNLVQKFAWFSLGDKIFPVADLVDFSDMQLTAIGQKFKESSFQISKH